METITQRVVRADGAAPVATKAARDVFSLASQAASEASTPPRKQRAGTQADRALQAIAACGELTSAQLADAIGVTKAKAQHLAHEMKRRELIVARKDGRGYVFSVASAAPTARPTGFKGWLQRKGEASAEGRAPRKPKTPAALTPLPALPALPEVQAPAPLCVGLFNTGKLRIEAPGQPSLELDKPQVQALFAYLARCAGLLQGAG